MGISMEQMIKLGQIDASDTLGTALHQASLSGSKKALKKVLDKGNAVLIEECNTLEEVLWFDFKVLI